ncbi:MAG: helix-turn-helix domain-containing protein [Syntrophomonadaceae bacterium]|nr:helix-turn-helix domain-containing protein [Syntrophomonadaceae bacterium]
MGIGEKFKAERIKQGYSLQEVEDDTKIRKYYLEAIENDNYDLLPPKVYATGFVRRYAKFLDLDVEECAQIFKYAAYGSSVKEELMELNPTSTPTRGIESSITWKNVAIALVFLIAVIWVGDFLIAYFTEGHKVPPQNNLPIVEKSDPEEEKPPEVVKPNKVIRGVEIIVEAEQNCWLSVIVDNESQYNATLPAGEELAFQGENKISLTAGNAGGITITYNGEKMPPLGNIGDVKDATYTALDNTGE